MLCCVRHLIERLHCALVGQRSKLPNTSSFQKRERRGEDVRRGELNASASPQNIAKVDSELALDRPIQKSRMEKRETKKSEGIHHERF